MKFEHEGKTYAIEFKREHKEVALPEPETPSVKIPTKSANPYTTVNILELESGDPNTRDAKWKVFRTYTVGCSHRDRFSPEYGRFTALRMALLGMNHTTNGLNLSKQFKSKAWAAYFGRFPKGGIKQGIRKIVNTKKYVGATTNF